MTRKSSAILGRQGSKETSSLPFSADDATALRVSYLDIGETSGGATFAIHKGDILHGITSDSELADVRLVGRAAAMERQDDMIQGAAKQTETLARGIFGDAAYLRRFSQIDSETGEYETVFEVHYCISDVDDMERLTNLHQLFTETYVRAIAADVRRAVVLRAVPSDAN